ncbi:AraC family transcriptional regulator [Paenibacillus woosongensis]|uniref:Helix-turn-helix domain-containing protein n=1 Tax=Paenibacillus woosongensis TaxID=307580 RepID=A0A7X3CPM5_9BACL|nr:AraC family transcriptional regulator [Paenibacillus woosongensis]MUG47953.1 helix-turn-helix domain-containing protein [Paenibacillus woosongensis]
MAKEGADHYSEIDEVIAYIHKHIDEPLELSRLANIALYSPYHFTRIFKEKIGLPPLYYVSALRLQKAKDLLLQTNLTIRDIGLEIGQQSLGTFTTRFTERVGVTPSEFRRSAQEADEHFKSLRNLSDWETMSVSSILLPGNSTIEGRIYSAVPFDGFILIGLFAKPIPEGLPLYGTLLPSLGRFRFMDVKPGTYYLMATSVSWEMQTKDFLLPHATLRTRSHAPIIVQPHTPVLYQEVMLHPARQDDPPILVSLPLLMQNFLNLKNQSWQRK